MNKLTTLLLLGSFLWGCQKIETRSRLTATSSNGIGSASLILDKYKSHCTPDGVYCAFFAPSDLPIFAVDDFLRSAKQSIKIMTYNMNVDWYGLILRERLQAGVKLEYLVDFKLSRSSNKVWQDMVSWNSESDRRKFGKDQLTLLRTPVMRGRNPQMHNKIIIIDDETILFGSANWTFTGLVGNYENVMVIHGVRDVVDKFLAEFNEIRDISLYACENFADNPESCGTGLEGGSAEDWQDTFYTLVTTGKFPKDVVPSDSQCKGFQYGFLNGSNLPKVGSKLVAKTEEEAFKRNKFKVEIDEEAIKHCLNLPEETKSKFVDLAKYVAARESFVDGDKTTQHASYRQPKFFKYSPRYNRDELTKVYFSPEDNPEFQITSELRATYNEKAGVDAKRSFAYVSTNFITNRRFATQLVEMMKAGVRVRVFFDRGRYYDPNFQHSVEKLKTLGLSSQSEQASLTVFNNELSGGYGCNHNKMAVLYDNVRGLRLLNGSANWSVSAMDSNDENLIISYDERISLVYLKEILSQLYVYRYGQNFGARQNDSYDLSDELDFIYGIPFSDEDKSFDKKCLTAMLYEGEGCHTYTLDSNGKKTDQTTIWQPRSTANIVVSAYPREFNQQSERLWATAHWWREGRDSGESAGEFFSYRTFEGKWVTSIAVPIAAALKFKLAIGPMLTHPLSQNHFKFEFNPFEHSAHAPPAALHAIPSSKLRW